MKRGFFAIGVYGAKREVNIGSLWRTASILRASYIYTVGRRYEKQSSDTSKTDRHIPLIHYRDIDDLAEHLPHGCQLVGVELTERAWDLKNFSHPQQCCYLLGAEDTGIPEAILAKCHGVIKLKGDYSMNVAVAGSIVMYHREAL